MSSEIVVPMITAIGGWAVGLLTRWAKWAVEKRKRKEDRRVRLIEN